MNWWHRYPTEFDALVRLGIPDPSSYIKKRFKSNKLLFLRAACVGQALVDQVEASVEEAVNSATWTDLQVSSLTFKLMILEELHRFCLFFFVFRFLFLILFCLGCFSQFCPAACRLRTLGYWLTKLWETLTSNRLPESWGAPWLSVRSSSATASLYLMRPCSRKLRR